MDKPTITREGNTINFTLPSGGNIALELTSEQATILDAGTVKQNPDAFQDVKVTQVDAPPAAVVHAKLITCPSDNGMVKGLGPVHVRSDGTCSYCGSLDPDILMERIEAGTIRLTGSDKNYKTYIENDGGAPLLQSHRTDDDRTGDTSKWVWTTREVSQGKFYFEHLSVEQRKRFVELYNERKIKHSLYVLPFFMTRAVAPAEATPIMPRTKSG